MLVTSPVIAPSFAIVSLRPPEERQEQFIDREITTRPGARPGQPSAVDEPFRDEPVVLGAARFGAEPAEVEIPAVQGDDGLATGPVSAIRRDALRRKRHAQVFRSGRLPAFEERMDRTAADGRVSKLQLSAGVMVSMPGGT